MFSIHKLHSDTRAFWILIILLASANIFEQFDRFLFTVAKLPYIDTTSYEYALLAGTMFSLVYCVGNLVIAMMNDGYNFDRCTVVAIGTIISSLALFAVPFMTNFGQQAALRLIMGAAQAPITAFCSALIKDAYDDSTKGLAFGIFNSGIFVGFGATLTLGTVMVDAEGWRFPYYVIGIAGVAFGILFRMLVKDTLRYRPHRNSDADGEDDSEMHDGDVDIEGYSTGEASDLVAVSSRDATRNRGRKGVGYSGYNQGVTPSKIHRYDNHMNGNNRNNYRSKTDDPHSSSASSADMMIKYRSTYPGGSGSGSGSGFGSGGESAMSGTQDSSSGGGLDGFVEHAASSPLLPQMRSTYQHPYPQQISTSHISDTTIDVTNNSVPSSYISFNQDLVSTDQDNVDISNHSTIKLDLEESSRIERDETYSPLTGSTKSESVSASEVSGASPNGSIADSTSMEEPYRTSGDGNSRNNKNKKNKNKRNKNNIGDSRNLSGDPLPQVQQEHYKAYNNQVRLSHKVHKSSFTNTGDKVIGGEKEGEEGDWDRARTISSVSGGNMSITSVVNNWYLAIKPIIAACEYCYRYPSVLIILLACAIRFAAGYCYSYYLAIFFSPLLNEQEDDGDTVSCNGATTITLHTYCTDSDYPYCVDGKCQGLSDVPWHNQGMEHEDFETWYAPMMVTGSVLGCICGGYIGDLLSSRFGLSSPGRLMLAGVTLIIAAPFYAGLYLLDFPSCFIMLFFGGFFGELYFAMSLAVWADLIPKRVYLMAIAIFISVNILVASNSTLLVPLLKKSLDNGKHGFTFSTDLGEVQEDATGSEGLQMSMVYLVAGLYLLAGIIYLISIPFVRIDMMKIQEADEFNLLTPLNT